MKNDSEIIIPLVSFSSGRERKEPDSETEEFFFLSDSYTRICPPMKLPDSCYGFKIQGTLDNSVLTQDCIAVFSKSEEEGLENIYAVRVKGELPFLGKLIKKETESKNASRERKVFMVPTPMHVPGSSVSPIAPSLHKVIMFKDFTGSGKLRLIPENKILWKHPLVYVQNE